VLAAVEAVQKGMSFGKASQKYNVPKNTIHRRFHGQRSQKERSLEDQELSPVLEQQLVSWIFQRCAAHQAPKHVEVREMASCYLGGKQGSMLGRAWMKKFLERNPQVEAMRAVAIESSRLVLPDRITHFFGNYDTTELEGIRPEDRWNMDETGLEEGDAKNGIAIGPSYCKEVLVAKSPSRTWCTALECINAENKYLPPLVIFKGANVQRQWIPQDLNPFEGWAFAATDTGWTKSEIAVKWLREIFLPCTLTDPPRPRMLIMDGHSTHMSQEFWHLCGTNDVSIVVLPSHSSHITQPLDVGVFASLKFNYRKQTRKIKVKDQGSAAGKRSMLEAYSVARQTAFLPCNIVSGWEKTGLWPIKMEFPLSSPYVKRHKEVEEPQITEERAQAMEDAEVGPLALTTSLIVAPPGETPAAARARVRRLRNAVALVEARSAELRQRNEELEAREAARAPQKRRRVNPSTPGGLVRTADLVRADAEVRAQEEGQREGEGQREEEA